MASLLHISEIRFGIARPMFRVFIMNDHPVLRSFVIYGVMDDEDHIRLPPESTIFFLRILLATT